MGCFHRWCLAVVPLALVEVDQGTGGLEVPSESIFQTSRWAEESIRREAGPSSTLHTRWANLSEQTDSPMSFSRGEIWGQREKEWEKRAGRCTLPGRVPPPLGAISWSWPAWRTLCKSQEQAVWDCRCLPAMPH